MACGMYSGFYRYNAFRGNPQISQNFPDGKEIEVRAKLATFAQS